MASIIQRAIFLENYWNPKMWDEATKALAKHAPSAAKAAAAAVIPGGPALVDLGNKKGIIRGYFRRKKAGMLKDKRFFRRASKNLRPPV